MAMMTEIEILLAALMVATAFLSGIFGMAGGMILIGVLLVLFPIPEAMALHAVTQMASNGWRAMLWRRYIRWKPIGGFLAGNGVAMAIWSIWLFVPGKALASLFLGLGPFLTRILPQRLKPNAASTASGVGYGGACMSLMVLTGVSGPLADSYFLASGLDRKEIVATKAIVQVAGHSLKLLYFGGLVAGAGALSPPLITIAILSSIVGATLARPVLERLSETNYRRWARWLLTIIAIYYLAQAAWLFWQSA